MDHPTQPSDTNQSHYVLLSLTRSDTGIGEQPGRWRFVLGQCQGGVILDVEDTEQDVSGERLDLLSVIRGLEALERPSSVTLFTSSRYVQRGVRYGLDHWRRSAWRWERFGRMVPIKNRDLWQRLDQALNYHSLECRYWCFDDEQRQSQPVGQQDAA